MHRILFALSILLLAPNLAAAKGRPSGGGGGGGHGGLQLTASAVVPGPGDATASATGTVSASRNEVCFSMTIGPLSGFIRTIAIYQGEVGQVGPMVVRLSPSPIGINQLIGCVPADGALCRDIARNPKNYFIQINTDQYPGGALRAQLGN